MTDSFQTAVLFYRKEVASAKSAKPTSTTKAAKEAEKTPKASRSVSAKEQAASAFDFDEGDEPAAKKQKTSSTVRGIILF